VTARFAGKAALVTGAAAGLGRATAQRLAAEGARVFGVDVDAGGLAETRAACPGGSFASLTADLATRAACREAVAAAVASGGGLDVLCNVANRKLRFPEGMDWKKMQGVMGKRGLATPEEVAEVVAFLASEQASRVHGAIWTVDDGVTAG
jgi:NAD(P)-dependent dehydrogenase (short-subunit alcohol dehydrogenase family)